MWFRVGVVARGTVLAMLIGTFVDIGSTVVSFKARLTRACVSIVTVGAAVICFAVFTRVAFALVAICVTVVTEKCLLTCAGVHVELNFVVGSGVGTFAVHTRV